MRTRNASWQCPPPDHEPVLHSLLGGLFSEGLLPEGSVVDAGANSGEDACYYAERLPSRIVHAIEPVAANVAHIRAKWAVHLPNLHVLRAGLGSENRLVRLAAAGRPDAGQGTQVTAGDLSHAPNVTMSTRGADADTKVFQVYPLDQLFETAWQGERLGFAHFDVEGGELDVLLGARRAIERDRPVFTMEVHVHTKAQLTASLLQLVDRLHYRSYMVEEQCGIPVDCRNILNLPIERLSLFQGSPILDLATASQKLFKVTARSIKKRAYAEVCSPGGACCPTGPPACCYSTCVQSWLKNLTGAKASALHAHVSFKAQNYRQHQLRFG